VAAVAPVLQRLLQTAGLQAGWVRRPAVFADPVLQRSGAASVVSHVDLCGRAEVARHVPGGLPDRADALLVTVVTPDPKPGMRPRASVHGILLFRLSIAVSAVL